LIVAVFVMALAVPATARKRHDEGPLVSLTVACATTGASVLVDGELVGATPLDLPVPVAPGEHTLKVSKPGYAPFLDAFSTGGRTEVKIELELQPVSGVVHVKSDVAGARVMLDGRYVGEAPLDVDVEVGSHAVRLVKGGYREFERRVATVAGQEVELAAHLDELPPELNPYRPAPPRKQRWYEKRWVWFAVAGGAVVAAGAATAGTILGGRSYDVCEHAQVCFR
jgi:hypothetical protein